MAYTVLARRYRSQTFEEVVGQEAVAKTLRGAIESGRVAHAYLFTGSRGVGKTSTARILAKALNCTGSDKPTVTPCNGCDVCKAVSVGEDVDVIEIDGASNNGVEQVRELRQNAIYRPARARFKIYIIDEVHMLSTAAFNALLKTLEEPPEHVKFIFATTEANKLPITIRSRCQRFDFRNIATAKIADNLRRICSAEGVEIDDEAVMHVARAGAGSMRDAVSLLDQLLSVGEKRVTADLIAAVLGVPAAQQVIGLFDSLLERDAPAALRKASDLLAGGMGVESLVEGLMEHLRTMLLAVVVGPDSELLEVGPETAAKAAAHGKKVGPAGITQMMSLCEQLQRSVRRNSAARALVDAAVWELANFDDLVSVGELLESLRTGALPAPAATGDGAKKKLEPLTPPPAAQPAAPPAAPRPPASTTSASTTSATTTPATTTPATTTSATTTSATTTSATTTSPARTPAAPTSPRPPTPQPPATGTPLPGTQPPAPAAQDPFAAAWPALLERLEGLNKPGLSACLGRARPAGIEDGFLVIELATAFDLKLCEGKDERELIVRTLEAVGAGRTGVKFRQIGEGSGGAAAGEAEKKPAADRPSRQDVAAVLSDPLISQAMELFGGRLVNIEKEE
jgi:DNA polymerase-3 subunit gamma/tau